MDKDELKNYFHSIEEEYYTINIQDNKIFFLDYTALTKFVSFILSIIVSAAYFYIAKNYFLMNGPTPRSSFTINDVYLTTTILFIGLFFYSLNIIRQYIVIDLNNNSIIKEFHFYSIKIRFKTINKNNILQIGNNIFPSKYKFKSKGYRSFKKFEPDPETNLFYTYSICFLLNNGETQNIFIGPHIEDYETSAAISKNISEYFNIPHITCNKGNVLSTKEYFNSYKFEETPSEYTKQISYR